MQIMSLPRHEAAEASVLGSMVLGELQLADAVVALQPTDFLTEGHQKLFSRMKAMYLAGVSVDLITFCNALWAAGELAIFPEGEAYICSLTEGIPRNADLGEHIRTLKDRGLARAGVCALQNAMERLLSQSEPASKVIDGLTRQLAEERPSDSKHIREYVPRALQALEPESFTLIKTGVSSLDVMTLGGARLGELWIVGGDPSSGKSALVRQMERAAIAEGFPIHAFSIEVTGVQWTQFHMANLAGVPVWKIRQPHLLNVVDKDKLRSAATQMDHWSYMLDDAGSLHIDALLSKARLSVMRQGTKVVTIDYLQMLDSSKKETREQLGDAAKRLKQFAKDHNCLVIALSQLNRAELNEEPNMRRLKDSSWLEQAGDVIALTHRPADAENHRPTGDDVIVIGKQRNGSRGSLKMRLDVDTLCWGSREGGVQQSTVQQRPLRGIAGGRATGTGSR